MAPSERKGSITIRRWGSAALGFVFLLGKYAAIGFILVVFIGLMASETLTALGFEEIGGPMADTILTALDRARALLGM